MSDEEVKLRIKFEGGDADAHRLELYDAGVAIHGLARALAISLHAFLNEGAIRSRVNKIEGARIYIQPSKKGSFEETIQIIIASGLVAQIGPSVLASAVWDFVKWTWAKATNQEAVEPKSRYAQKLLRANDNFDSEIAMALENPLAFLHRPIAGNEKMTITVTRTQTSEKIEFTKETLAYVTTDEKPALESGIKGNVTKYNILTGNGRFYDDELNKTISFSLDNDVSGKEKELLSQSMDQRNKGYGGKILITANRVVNKMKDTKRYVIVSVHEFPVE